MFLTCLYYNHLCNQRYFPDRSNFYYAQNKNYYEYGRSNSGIKRKLIANGVTSSGTYKQCADGTLFSSLNNITIDNFACIPKSVSGSGMVSSTGWYDASSNTTVSMSYSNGVLSISGLSATYYDGSRQWNSCTSTIDIYVYYTE